MELKARNVLEDVISAFEMLEVEENPQKFRIIWIAAISLCRSVGQVLDKTDAPSSESLGEKIKEQWNSIKNKREENLIFYAFIEEHRNLILKEYEIGYLFGEFQITNGEQTLNLENGLYSPVCFGPYKGEDCRDVLKQAIEWWDGKLSEIEGHVH